MSPRLELQTIHPRQSVFTITEKAPTSRGLHRDYENLLWKQIDRLTFNSLCQPGQQRAACTAEDVKSLIGTFHFRLTVYKMHSQNCSGAWPWHGLNMCDGISSGYFYSGDRGGHPLCDSKAVWIHLSHPRPHEQMWPQCAGVLKNDSPTVGGWIVVS